MIAISKIDAVWAVDVLHSEDKIASLSAVAGLLKSDFRSTVDALDDAMDAGLLAYRPCRSESGMLYAYELTVFGDRELARVFAG